MNGRRQSSRMNVRKGGATSLLISFPSHTLLASLHSLTYCSDWMWKMHVTCPTPSSPLSLKDTGAGREHTAIWTSINSTQEGKTPLPHTGRPAVVGGPAPPGTGLVCLCFSIRKHFCLQLKNKFSNRIQPGLPPDFFSCIYQMVQKSGLGK